MKYLAFTGLLFIKFSLLPDKILLFWMGVAIAIDFVTGFSKAVFLHQNRTSNGLRKTITKFLQYGGGLAIGVILTQAAQQHKVEGIEKLISYFNDGLVMFIIYVEVTSILENLIAIDDKSPVSKLFVFFHRILTAQIKKVEQNVAAIEDPTQDSFTK
jgi:hypothetical protein